MDNKLKLYLKSINLHVVLLVVTLLFSKLYQYLDSMIGSSWVDNFFAFLFFPAFALIGISFILNLFIISKID
ncbi:hypothetical protein L0P54_09030 [Anaerosalibacter bizertensis]|uniref:Uncharacterized protein n=1 Tax=Anaerosalibacter bizertensis TaxID=932217 RepID=A0A9Q4ACF4_9FIRM|nr:hypothetical protein [Anaerosalibacter bizertensis]MBV1819885.1 hypothetical protein [Bacteroidales bacterium MSK.15.36]HHV27636.1 hypothetical protein [Tissierellia bacterium]MBU5294349.1 hypothetical protein [Anaerosalibacter bizertensis]MCB5560668.1 hypothetical protein [Anaerosalibacter bizertensis]MCG4564978.1 hypothetical protein [Anaerosalibacter bizertensis]